MLCVCCAVLWSRFAACGAHPAAAGGGADVARPGGGAALPLGANSCDTGAGLGERACWMPEDRVAASGFRARHAACAVRLLGSRACSWAHRRPPGCGLQGGLGMVAWTGLRPLAFPPAPVAVAMPVATLGVQLSTADAERVIATWQKAKVRQADACLHFLDGPACPSLPCPDSSSAFLTAWPGARPSHRRTRLARRAGGCSGAQAPDCPAGQCARGRAAPAVDQPRARAAVQGLVSPSQQPRGGETPTRRP